MKVKLIFGIIFCLCFSSLNAQTSETITNKLIGKWDYLKTIDSEKTSVEYIIKKYPNGKEMKVKANGPNIIINKNGTYSKQFTLENIDSGNWQMKSEDEIEYEMVIPKKSRQGKLIIATQKMINRKWEKDKKGNFLDKSISKIISISEFEMKIEYEKDYVMIFKKQSE